MAKICVLLSDGFEEIEAITIIDVLRRGGIEVSALGVSGLDVRGSHQVRLHADGLLRDFEGESWDAVVLPGGMPGSEGLRDNPDVQTFLRTQAHRPNVVLAAICAAPIALAKAGILNGLRATCYPGFEEQLEGATLSEDTVVTDGRVMTSRGPGTAMAFALALVERFAGATKARQVQQAMLLRAAPASSMPIGGLEAAGLGSQH